MTACYNSLQTDPNSLHGSSMDDSRLGAPSPYFVYFFGSFQHANRSPLGDWRYSPGSRTTIKNISFGYLCFLVCCSNKILINNGASLTNKHKLGPWMKPTVRARSTDISQPLMLLYKNPMFSCTDTSDHYRRIFCWNPWPKLLSELQTKISKLSIMKRRPKIFFNLLHLGLVRFPRKMRFGL